MQAPASPSSIRLEVFDRELVRDGLCNSRPDLLEDGIAGSCALSDGSEGLLQVHARRGIVKLAAGSGNRLEWAMVRPGPEGDGMHLQRHLLTVTVSEHSIRNHSSLPR